MITGSNIESFLATAVKVLTEPKDFEELKKNDDYILLYNNNSSFFKDETGKEKNTSYLGSIIWNVDYSIKKPNYAFPFDKNNITYPIEGETVTILKIDEVYYWLPYSRTQYPNYRQDYITLKKSKQREYTDSGNTLTTTDYKETRETGTTNRNFRSEETSAAQKQYKADEKIKYLKPYIGDTIITGRLGSSIRISQNFKNGDKSPLIIIRNGQSTISSNKPIGELIEEDINNDGTSIYISSGNINVPLDFSKVEKTKNKQAWKDFPESDNLIGHQLYINSDRVVLSSKASEFIIVSKGNSGVITDGNFTIDSKKSVFVNTEDVIEFQSKNDNYLTMSPIKGGKIYIGKRIENTNELSNPTTKDSEIQQMVLGNVLVGIIDELITAISQQQYLTPSGPTKIGPENLRAFNDIKRKLNTILSNRLLLSK
jgi:hypothetical protein